MGNIWPTRTYLVPLATLKPVSLAERQFKGMRFDPAGKRVIGTREPTWMKPRPQLIIIDTTTKVESNVPLPDGATAVIEACWSPDGRRILFHWWEKLPDRKVASRLSIADPNGKNALTILQDQNVTSISGIEWR